jgi:hypothetical protein
MINGIWIWNGMEWKGIERKGRNGRKGKKEDPTQIEPLRIENRSNNIKNTSYIPINIGFQYTVLLHTQ